MLYTKNSLESLEIELAKVNEPSAFESLKFTAGDKLTASATQPVISGVLFACVLRFFRPDQPNGVMSSAVSLSNHTFTSPLRG